MPALRSWLGVLILGGLVALGFEAFRRLAVGELEAGAVAALGAGLIRPRQQFLEPVQARLELVEALVEPRGPRSPAKAAAVVRRSRWARATKMDVIAATRIERNATLRA